jgi:hypothetical protein
LAKDTFIVGFTERLVGEARKLSVFFWVEKRFGPLSFAFVDGWTLFFLAASLASYCIALFTNHLFIQFGIIAVSIIRLFEYLCYLLWVILFAKPNKGTKDIRSYKRTMLLLMSNYLETIFWFATWLALLAANGSIQVDQGPLVFALIRESVMMMVANWSGNVVLKSSLGVAVITFQDAIGLFMTIVVVARVVALLPRPSSADPNET